MLWAPRANTRWAGLHGSAEGKPVRRLWLEHGEGQDLRGVENVLKPVPSVAIWISLSQAGMVLQPRQAKAGGRCQAREPWQPSRAVMLRRHKPAHGHNQERSFPPASRTAAGGSSRAPRCAPPTARRCSRLLLDLQGPLSPRRGGARPLPALYVREKGFTLLPCLQIPQSLNLQTE